MNVVYSSSFLCHEIRANWFNYFNMTEIDTSGTFRFLTDELQDAEDAGERGM